MPNRAYAPGFFTHRLGFVAGLLYFALAAATIHLASNGRDVASIWPANAVLLALLLRNNPVRWGEVLAAGFIGNVAANFVTRGSLTAPVLFGTCNLVEVGVAAIALRRFIRQSSPIGAPETLGQFIVWAGLVAPAISGVGGAATAALLFGGSFAEQFATWFLSDALGLLIFTPFWLSVFNAEYLRCFRDRSALQRLELAGLHLLTLAVAIGVFFASRQPLLFVLFPPVMLVSFRIGRLGTQMSVMLIAVTGALATMHGLGPITLVTGDHARQAEYFQFFLAVILLSCLPMSAGLSARKSLTAELYIRERKLQQDKADLAKAAMTDPLTGLLNRAGFQAAASSALATQAGQPLWLLAIDVDRFKEINDRYGHQAGDIALVSIAEMLRSVLPQHIIGRMGGDEFLVLLQGASEQEAHLACERLMAGVSSLEAKSTPLSISCGAASAGLFTTLDELARRADAALYEAKNRGRGRTVVNRAASLRAA